MARSRLFPFEFGNLPVDAINKALDTEFDPGTVVMPVNAQRHAQRRHPEEFPVYFPHVAALIQAPLYVGDDIKNPGKIELVGRPVGAPMHLLVAVEVKRDEQGRYTVVSFYPISEAKIENRSASGHLKRCI